MRTILLLIFILTSATIWGQTEEERRAIIAAKNKIQSDSLSLHSRSMRVQEAKKQNEQLINALEQAYKTIGLYEEVKTSMQTDLEICSDSLSVTQTQLETATQSAETEKKRKEGWRKVGIGAILLVAVETAILVLL